MNCPSCNTQLLPDARFCGSCGRVMQSFESTANASPGTQSNAEGTFNIDSDGRGQGRGYTWVIEHQGAFALAVVNLEAEQSISAEAGAMVSMSANVDLQAELKGGVFG